jgi:DNA-binding FadR family transcriptional regulator
VDQIARGDLRAGYHLPSEPALAAQFRVSRAGVREALRMLEQAGLVEIKRGARGGAFIRETSPARISEGLALLYEVEGIARDELAEARHMLEATTARLAAVRATEDDLDRMRRALALAEQEPTSHQVFVRSNGAFHAAVGRAAHNRVFEMMLASIHGLIDRSLLQARMDPPTIARAIADHRRIYQAIAAHRPNRAEAAMLEHIESFEYEFRDIYLSPQIKYGTPSTGMRDAQPVW